MKNPLKPITTAAAVLLLLQSCSMDETRLNKQNSPEDNSLTSDVLMFSEQEFISASMTETLSQEKHHHMEMGSHQTMLETIRRAYTLSTSMQTSPSIPLDTAAR